MQQMIQNIKPDVYYSRFEIQTVLKVSPDTIYRWITQGLIIRKFVANEVRKFKMKLPAFKAGADYRVLGADLQEFIKKKTEN